MTRRFNIENLERRQMYAAHPFMDYTDDDAVSVAAGDVNGDGAADIVLASNAAASVKSPRDVATGQADGLFGAFNNDGRDDVAEFFGSVDYNHPDLNRAGFYDLLVSSFASGGGDSVPMEQFSLNFATTEFKDNAKDGDDLIGWDAGGAVEFASHTLPHADGVLIGMLLPFMEQDNVYNLAEDNSRKVAGIDVWEHAYLQNGPATNGIIAVLIGLVQPETDGNSNTAALERGPATNGIIAILIGLKQDVTDGTSNTMMLTVDPRDTSGNTVSAAILASDEFFSQFADGSASRFDHGYLPPGGNSILHEENEFSFPRMIRGV